MTESWAALFARTTDFHNEKSSSLQSLGATFIPVLIYSALCLLFFCCFRRKCGRVYAPRTMPSLRSPHRATPILPDGWFNWVVPFFKIPDTFILNHSSLDGFFFLRYLRVLRNIFLVGICITWPILFAVHVTGHNGVEQLDLLTIGNIKDPRRMWAHVVVAWLFFGFVLFTISRECIYYVGIRQAFLSSPHYAKRLSSRTLLVTSIPERYLDEARIRKLYGDSVKRVWIPRTAKALIKLVEEREQTALRLEKAEITLIKKANMARKKQMKIQPPTTSSSAEPCAAPSNSSIRTETDSERPRSMSQTDTHDLLEKSAEDPEYVHPYGLNPDLPDVRGSVAAQWIPVTVRPHHRPLHNFFRRVDTIRWCRKRLKELNLEIFKLRRQVRRGDGTTLPAAFIEFDTQESAQAAHQVVAHHRPLQLAPRILGVRPDEVVWSSLRMRWWERIIRRFLIMGLVTTAIIFWSIPSAFIGIISNIKFLTTIPFLTWINLLPGAVTGFLQGFLPAIALSFWMSLVPAMLRFCGIRAGIPSMVLVELFTQEVYFAFQIVQVFLITTLTSAASATVMTIIKEPLKTPDLLAENLPKASNFYLSYILVQCLAIGATGLLHIFELIRHYAFARLSQIPRARFNVWYKLQPPKWGGVYPIYTNMAVIALSYTCIAPLILIFACAGMTFVRIIYRYNILYVFDSEMDSLGLFYPNALIHLIVGLYLAEICMIGLFALKLAFPPMVMMLIFLIITGLVHLSLRDSISPLLKNLPQTLSLEEELQQEEKAAAEAKLQEAAETGQAEQNFGEEEMEDAPSEDEDDHTHEGPQSSRAVEGAGGLKLLTAEWIKSMTKEKLKSEAEQAEQGPVMKFLNKWILPPTFMKRFFHPEIYEDFIALRKLIHVDDQPEFDYEVDEKLSNYWPPELWRPKPVLWIPRDDARVSRQEVAHTRKITPITDVGVGLNEKGLVVVDVEAAPFPRLRLLH
ncbi:uncharacterized protein NECHADRAFT_96579 [Fusarium vanettenii 77-13-4]|uniref:DUF221 domain-containing protein n=1 Tax=Fusarium vanettenii (strain ATCC MYA-4622 / CBS 123669 / FGSC 9596 / NRRL 45880 / 77-13-4) TaxID=660122 RepID=C7ZNM2_FUSV7|nr:uncharacterized protein NECHADRAFT_96579 [Fusarium vanettenii 77-13-4]EEU34202.1 hypothetical protein NECHADRAFT_96579 [Fusarium vanettenii 77-13-4]